MDKVTGPPPEGYRWVKTPVSHREYQEPVVIGVLADGFEETEFSNALRGPKTEVRAVNPQGGAVAEQVKGLHALLIPPHTVFAVAATTVPAPFSVAVVQSALQQGMPVRGLNEGCLLLNVAAGGTLQRAPDRHLGGTHGIAVVPDSLLDKRLGGGRNGLRVATSHSMALDRLAPGFHASALSAEGTVEAIEHPKSRSMGLQFVPRSTREQFSTTLVSDAYAFWDQRDPLYVQKLEKYEPPPLGGNRYDAKEKACELGFYQLELQGFQLWDCDGKQLDVGDARGVAFGWGRGPQTYHLRRHDSNDNLLTLERWNVSTLLLTFSPDYKAHMRDSQAALLDMTRTLTDRGGTWFRASGFLGRTLTPLNFEVERLTTFVDGRLRLKLGDTMHKVKGLDALEKLIKATATAPAAPQ